MSGRQDPCRGLPFLLPYFTLVLPSEAYQPSWIARKTLVSTASDRVQCSGCWCFDGQEGGSAVSCLCCCVHAPLSTVDSFRGSCRDLNLCAPQRTAHDVILQELLPGATIVKMEYIVEGVEMLMNGEGMVLYA